VHRKVLMDEASGDIMVEIEPVPVLETEVALQA